MFCHAIDRSFGEIGNKIERRLFLRLEILLDKRLPEIALGRIRGTRFVIFLDEKKFDSHGYTDLSPRFEERKNFIARDTIEKRVVCSKLGKVGDARKKINIKGTLKTAKIKIARS